MSQCQLCVSLADSHFPRLLKEIKRAAQWADWMEIRLDTLFFSSGHLSSFEKKREMMSQIHQHAHCPLIWTLRKKSQGGSFEGTEKERFDLLSDLLCYHQPTYIDFEADISEEMFHSFQILFPHINGIISWHCLEETPIDLEKLYCWVSRLPATYYKIATFAHSTIDAMRMLNFTQKVNRNKRVLCGLCMGEKGQSTRILAGMMGQPFTFASLEKGKETALGQLTAEELHSIYHFPRIDQKTQLFGLIGRPVDQSVSHLTHNAIFRELALHAVYVKFCLEDRELFPFFYEIASLPVKGLSVTMPFKEKVLAFLSDSSSLSACNTLIKEENGWKGENTDGVGALKALESIPKRFWHFGCVKSLSSLKGEKLVILGAGGTAKAIAHAAHEKGMKLAILNRTLEKAKDLAVPLQAAWGGFDHLPGLMEQGYHCVIQATPVGMSGQIKEMPVPAEAIAKEAIVLDVISNPSETPLLREVRKRGGKTISGQELFIHQAVEQFHCWFGPQIIKEEVEKKMRHSLFNLSPHVSVSVKKSSLKGVIQLPPSKSHTIRAILLAAFTKGTSVLSYPLHSPDTACAVEAARQFGAKVTPTSTGFAIQGVAGYPCTPPNVIDVGNSGQLLRFVGALSTLCEGYTVVTGDASIRSNRPIQPLLNGLRGLKVWAVSTGENGYAPFIIKGPLQAGRTDLEGEDSQPVSALLMAAAFTEGQTEIHVHHPGEKPWLLLTLSWLDRLKVHYRHQNLEHFIIEGKRVREAFEVAIPGDLSSLAFPLAAALITHSDLLIEHADLQDVQGDKALIFLLQRMGACFEIDPSTSCIKVLQKSKLRGEIIDANDFIDAVPILAVIGCFAEGETEIVNVSIARKKESNRLACMVAELKKMGAQIEETEEGLKVKHSSLRGADVKSHGDHRIAMALIVAGFGAEGVTEVEGIECISKSYPHFIEDFQRIGADLKLRTDLTHRER